MQKCLPYLFQHDTLYGLLQFAAIVDIHMPYVIAQARSVASGFAFEMKAMFVHVDMNSWIVALTNEDTLVSCLTFPSLCLMKNE